MPHINNKGLLYNNRTPKDVYFLYQANLLKNPVIHIASRDWPIRKGIQLSSSDSFVVQPVKIYSNLEKIELFQNGKWLGVQNTNKGVAVWNVPFVNGKNFLFAKGVNEKSGCEDGMEINFEIVPLNLIKIKIKLLNWQ